MAGVICVVICALFSCLVTSNPLTHRLVSQNELKEINEGRAICNNGFKPPVPWREFLTSKPVWGLIFGKMGYSWGMFMAVSRKPTYLNDVLEIPISKVRAR